MENIFETIVSDKTQKKKVISFAKKLAKKYSLKSEKDLENLTNLCYWLYIYDQKDKARSICEIVDDVPFKNDFNIWTWVEVITALLMRILREQGDIEKIGEYRQRLTKSYEEDAELLHEVLNGSLLFNQKIKDCTDEGDLKGADAWNFLQVSQLCLMRELGGNETYPIETLDKEIDRLKAVLCR